MRIDDGDRARIAAAVTAAEATTDGEIVVIAAEQSDSYDDAVLQWAALGMFATMAVQTLVPGHFVGLLDAVAGGWGRAWTLAELLGAELVLLVLVFLGLRFGLGGRAARMLVTPASTKARRVRRRAVLLFRAGIEARTATRTGVLLYLSLAEHRAEIVADAAVLAAVPEDAWGEAMAELVAAMRDGRAGDGVVAAIERIRAILAVAFPHSGRDPNELPDRLIEL